MFRFSRGISRCLVKQAAVSSPLSASYVRRFSSGQDDEISNKKASIFEMLRSMKKTDTNDSKRKEKKSAKEQQKDAESVPKTMKKLYNPVKPKPVSPELNAKLKSIISTLKVDKGNTRLSQDILSGVRSWGRPSAFTSRNTIADDFLMQSTPRYSKVLDTISFTSGQRFESFDDITPKKLSIGDPSPELRLLEGETADVLELRKQFDQKNDFRAMIEISDKQWKFPIDNEVVKVEEENVGFEEHVFLGYLLDHFPKKGPVRLFMELVVNGLEQNPYMSVHQKKNQVLWFKDYFEKIPEKDLSF